MHGDVARAVGEVLANHGGQELVATETGFADAGLATNLDAFVAATKHKVDHAGNRIRSIDRRVRTGDDVDPLDQVVRDGIDVGRDRVVENVRSNVAATIDQHQGADSAETAQIEQAEAGDADAEAGVLLRKGAAQLRQIVELVTDVGVAGAEELLTGNRGHRNRRLEIGTRNARSGDHDRLRFFLDRLGRSRVLGLGGSAGGKPDQGGGKRRALQAGGAGKC